VKTDFYVKKFPHECLADSNLLLDIEQLINFSNFGVLAMLSISNLIVLASNFCLQLSNRSVSLFFILFVQLIVLDDLLFEKNEANEFV
jgi:hypothetical protein